MKCCFKGMVAVAATAIIAVILKEKFNPSIVKIEIVAPVNDAAVLAYELRQMGFGITQFECMGLHGPKMALDVKLRKEDLDQTLELLDKYENLFITVSKIESIPAGKIKKRVILEKPEF